MCEVLFSEVFFFLNRILVLFLNLPLFYLLCYTYTLISLDLAAGLCVKMVLSNTNRM